MSIPVFVLLFLLSLSGAVFFAGSETGILAADVLVLRQWSERGSRGARSVLKMLERKDTVLATLLVGNNLAIVSASALATSFFTQRFGQNGAVISILIVSPMMLVFGEILPKAVYLTLGNRLLVLSHWLITVFIVLFRPLSVTAMVFPRMLVRGHADWTPGLDREDIRVLVKTSDLAGDLAREERLMISRLLELKDRRVSRAMVPIIETTLVPATARIRDAHTAIRKRGVSRLPIYSDRTDNIVGVVFATDLLRSADPTESIMIYSRKPFFVPEQKTIIELFREFYRKREMAIVVDEYGVATGIITMEDMIEEVIGDIQDEYDDETRLFQPLATGGTLIDSRIPVKEFNERFGRSIPAGDYTTVAGFLMMVMQKIPCRGDTFAFGALRFTILDATPQRIGRVVVNRISR